MAGPSSSKWHSSLPPLKPPTTPLPTLPQHELANLLSRAESLHAQECESFASSGGSGSREKGQSELSFFSKIVQTGTLSDRFSALTLMVQGSPVHNTKALETLRGMAERGKGKGGREEALKAVRCIMDWWVGGGAPDRKLKYFRDQSLTHPDRTDAHLVLWYFEDWLKKYFFNVLQTLETLSLDPLPYVRTQSLTLISTLLKDKPEQEHNLLRLLVNKLGDPEKSIASRASYHILQVLQAHPSMKSIFVREISSVVFHSTNSSSLPAAFSSSLTPGAPQNKHIRFDDKKGKSEKKKDEEGRKVRTGHVQYYSVITLNQIVLAPGDVGVAAQLISIYFDIFRQVLGSPDSSAAPSAPEDDEEHADHGEKKVDSKGRIHNDFNPKSKGKKIDKKKGGKADVEVKGAGGFVEVEDANARLVSAILTGVNRALPFAKLDGGEGSDVYKHIDTLFTITHKSSFNTSLQAMVLIQQIASSLQSSAPSSSKSKSSSTSTKPEKNKKGQDREGKGGETDAATKVVSRYHRTFYASLHDPRLASSSKQAMYLNLLFKTLKSDTELERVKAVVRRFVQVLVSGAQGGGGSEFVAGGLYLLGELFSSVPGLRAMVNAPPKKTSAKEGSKASKAAQAGKGNDSKGGKKSEDGEKDEEAEAYDPRKRDPLYAHAGASPLWELTPLIHHHHPAIALHARQLLSSQPLTAHADLSQNTLSHFLDRFVYKNPKQLKAGQDGARGPSAMQPAASGVDGVKLVRGEAVNTQGEKGTVRDREFVERRQGDVGVDEVFFWKFFREKREREERMAKGRKRGGDSDSEDEEESDGEAGKARRKKAGKKVEESDVDMDDAADSDEDDDEEASDGELDEDEVWKAMQATMPKANGDSDLESDGSDDDDSDLMDSGDEEEFDRAMQSESGSEVEVEEDGEEDDWEDEEDEDEKEGSDDDDEGLSLVEDSDNEDLMSLNDDVPAGLIPWDGPASEDEDEEWGGVAPSDGKKRKRGGEKETAKEKRKKLKSLPTFASYEDYAKLIEASPEDDI